MIVLTAHYTVKDGQKELVLERLQEMANLVRHHEPGCKLYQLSVHNENPNDLLLYELYDDQAAVDAHRETPYFQQLLLDKIVPLLDKRTVSFYTLAIE